MNFSEFKRRLGAEPRSQDAGLLAARAADPEMERAAVEAEAFEQKLEAALNIAPPAGLLDDILAIPAGSDSSRTEHGQSGHRKWLPYALAASVLVAVGAAGLAWQQSQQLQSIENYLADHYRHDGMGVIATALDGPNPSEIDNIMAALDARVSGELSDKIRFIKFCPTPQGRGAHMVVSTESGPVTVIFMPDSEVEDRSTVFFDGNSAYLVGLSRGSAAVIGAKSRNLSGLDTIVRQSIQPLVVDV